MAHPIESSIVLTDAACKLLFIDTGTLIEIDGSTNLSFTDAITGTKTLAELVGNGDVTSDASAAVGRLAYYTTDANTIGGNDRMRVPTTGQLTLGNDATYGENEMRFTNNDTPITWFDDSSTTYWRIGLATSTGPGLGYMRFDVETSGGWSFTTKISPLILKGGGEVYMETLGDDDTEDHVVAINDSTGLLTKRSVSSLAGSSLWLRNAGASYVYPATSGDNVWVDVGSAIYLGGANNKIDATSSSSMRFYVGGVNRLFIGNGDVSLENSNLLCNLNGTIGDATHFWYGVYSSDYTVDNVDTIIARDGSGNLTFVDGVTSIKTLAELASAGSSVTIGDTGEVPYSNSGTPGTDFSYSSSFTFNSNTLTIGGGSATSVFNMANTGSYDWKWTATGDTSFVLSHYTDTFVTHNSTGSTFGKDVITDGVFKSTGGAALLYSVADVDTRITLAPSTAQYASFYYWEEGTSTLRDMRFGESTANNGIYWDASANRMGIQDDTPSYTLDVNGTFGINGNMSITGSRTISPISASTAYSLTIRGGEATSSDGGTLILNGGNATGLGSDGGDIDIVGGSSTTSTGGHVFITGNPSSGTDGNVYIGRNAAGTIADANCIVQNTGEVGFYLRSSLTSNDVAIRFQQGTTSGTTVGIIGWDDSASRMTIQAGSTLGNTGRFSMSSTAIYYYGGSTASLYLDAVSSVSSVYLDSASTSDSRIYFRNDTTYRFIVGYDYSASTFQIHSSASFTSTADFQISLAGDISMGTAPSTTYPLNMYKSHTSGTQYMINIYHDGNNATAAQGIRMQMGLDTLTTSDQNYILALDGNGTTVGAILADSTSFRIYNAVSSKNYKKNIRPMTGGALQKFRNPKAQPKTYNWKGFRPEDEAILAETGEDAIDLNGFVIEDLEEMFPDVVKYIDDGDGNRTRPSYADTALIKYLVQALVELDTRVDELEDQLKTQ